MPLAESLRPQVHQRALTPQERIDRAQLLGPVPNETVWARSGALPDDVTCPDCNVLMGREGTRYLCLACGYEFNVTPDPQTHRLLPDWGWQNCSPVGKPMLIHGQVYQRHRMKLREVLRRRHVLSFFYKAARERA